MKQLKVILQIQLILLIGGIGVLTSCFSDIELPPDTWEEYMGYSSSLFSSSSEEESNSPSSSSSLSSSSSSEIADIGVPSFWNITTDRGDLNVITSGTSTVGNEQTDGSYEILMQEGGETVAKIQSYVLGRDLVNRNGDGYSSHIELLLGITGNADYEYTFNCNKGFTYDYKGSAHRFALGLSTVTDDNDHYVQTAASADWKTVAVSLSQFKQENWGRIVSLDISKITSLFWQVRGGLSATTGDLAVKNIGCYQPQCGNRTESYDENKYDCVQNGKIYLKEEYQPVDNANKSYKAVLIGSQTWMAENLNYEVDDSYCYDHQESNCDTYGRLYNWSEAITVCPNGWHLPSQAEWNTLRNFVENDKGCTNCSGTYLRTSGWNNGSYNNGFDSYGFTAIPGGEGQTRGYYFGFMGSGGYWWSASENSAGYGYFLRIDTSTENAYWNANSPVGASQMCSVRCLKN